MKSRSIILIVGVCLFAACSGNQKPVDMTRQETKNKNQYQIGSITEKALSSNARLPGQLKPFNEVNIFPKVNGFVKKLFVDRGTIVKKGELLITLEAPEMESQLQAANSRYLQAQENALASKEKYRRLKEAKNRQIDFENNSSTVSITPGTFMPRVPFLILNKTKDRRLRGIILTHNLLCLIVYGLFLFVMIHHF